MQRFKRTVALLLAVIIPLCLPQFAFAADGDYNGTCGDNLTWSLDAESGTLTVSGSGDMSDFIVGGAPWYSVRAYVKYVVVGDGVISIGNNAFYDCSALEKITLPQSLKSIDKNALRDCEKLKEAILPSSLEIVDTQAFYASGIEQISIPASVKNIGKDAFGWCMDLTSFSVDSDNRIYSSDNYGVLFNKDKSELIKFPCNSPETDYSVAEGVKHIAENAFENGINLKNVSVPASVSEIGYGAFYNCALENIVVSDSNADYSNDAYGVLFDKDKTYLVQYPISSDNEVYIMPDSVTAVQNGAFANAESLKGIALSENIKAIESYAFLYCGSLEYLHIPAGVTEIGEEIIDTGAYICSDSENCFAKDYAQANGFTFKVCTAHTSGREIMASGNCGESALWILYADGEIVIFGAGAVDDFEKDGAPWSAYAEYIKKATFKEGITNVSDNAFNGCELLDETNLASSVSSIGESAFKGCSALEEIDISVSVTEIGADAFDGSAVKNVNYDGTVTQWCAIEFGNEKANPASVADALFVGGEELGYCVIPDGATKIGAYAFAGYEKLSGIEIPESVSEIGAGAFAGCDGLKYVHIPADVIRIGDEIIAPDTYICSDSESAFAKEYAQKNGYVFKLCANHSVIGVTLSETEITITNKMSYQLTATVIPEGATDVSVSWKSDRTTVAGVDETGKITAVSVGEATVTVTTSDGGYSSSCKVTVVPEEYTVKWIVDGTVTETLAGAGAVIVKPEDPVKTGYTFTGWVPEIPATMPSENLEFVATFSADSYDAVFDANGGKWADESTETVVVTEFGKRISAPEKPIREGYAFEKWSPEVGVMDSVDGKKFTAVWTPLTNIEYTVETYVMNADGTYAFKTEILYGTTDSTVDAEYILEEGFELNSEKSNVSATVSPDGSTVLKVYLDRVINEVIINGETVEILYGATVNKPTEPDVPEGHKFDGWVDENGEKIDFPMVYGDGFPTEIKPVFVRLSYSVSWNNDGNITSESYLYGSEIQRPADPEKYGYNFIGWTPEIPETMPAESLEFTAVFEKIIYTCPYDGCGEKFENESEYNEHIAYEQSQKAVRISIKNNPGTAKIKYGETLKLTAVTTDNIDGVKICWYVNGEFKAEGETFSLRFESGEKTVEVKLVDETNTVLTDENGNEITDSQKVKVDSSIWQKIVSFFKNLFRLNRVITQAIFAR